MELLPQNNNLKEKYNFNLSNKVHSILTFKNEKNENIIAMGLEFQISQKCQPQNEIYFHNLNTKEEWSFSLYSNNFSAESKKIFVDHLVFYPENNNYLVASRCSNDQNIYIFDYKTGEILRRITVIRADCLLFKSFKYRGTTRFAYDINKKNVNLMDFETSKILFIIPYKDFEPFEAKKIRFISNRLIIALVGRRNNAQCVIRLLDLESREIILEHGIGCPETEKNYFFNLVPLRNITKFCKILINFSTEEIECGNICLKYNIDGTIINEKCEIDENPQKRQRFLMKWGERNYELMDLLNDGVIGLDLNSWKALYRNKLIVENNLSSENDENVNSSADSSISFSTSGVNNSLSYSYKIDKIKINNVNYLCVLYENGRVSLYTNGKS